MANWSILSTLTIKYMQIDNKELAVIKGQISKLENQANSIVIIEQKDYANAIDIVVRFKETGSTIKLKKESINSFTILPIKISNR